MDLDFYDIENNIQPGDTSATITLTSNQDLVMINNVITVLNVELPDATIEIDNAFGADECGDRDITVEYTVYNVNSTDILPAKYSHCLLCEHYPSGPIGYRKCNTNRWIVKVVLSILPFHPASRPISN